MPRTKYELGRPSTSRPFTDREEYLAAFEQALGSRDLQRHKVLMYYGVGGIGKTSILGELRRSLSENYPDIAHAQIDFRDRENFRPSTVLIRMRGALNERYGISFPTFDIAYSLYWKLANPHLPLSKSELRFLDEGEIAGAAVALLKDVPVLGIVAQLPQIIDKHGRKALAWWRKRGQQELSHLATLDGPQDVEDWLPAFFCADLKAWIEEDMTRHAVLFLDTFEALRDWGNRGDRGSAHDEWVRDWVAHLPGVLVVIAGRSKLYWQDEDAEWKPIIEQHLVGKMEAKDCNKFLMKSGIREAKAREAITTQSGGVPFYLDLAVDTYDLIQSRENRLPKAKEFDENLEQLLDRFLHYLSDAQEACVFVLSVPEAFDLERFKDLVESFPVAYPATKKGLQGLLKFSFVEEVENGRYALHALMRKALEKRHDSEERRTIHQHLFDAAQQVLKSEEITDEYRTALREGVYHGMACQEPEVFLGWFLNAKESLHDALEWRLLQPLKENILSYAERVLGPDHPDTLRSVNNLGGLLHAKGDYAAAEPLYRRALEGRERVLGPNHSDTLGSVNNLGALLQSKGDYAAAEPLFRRALEGYERVLGPDHPYTLSSVDNLGAVLQSKGDYAAAEPLCRRALEGRERVLGPDHSSTLNSVNNLGYLLHAKGDYAAAEPLFRRALEGRERVLGPDHSGTLNSVNNLGYLLQSKGDYAAAEPLYRRALEGYERVLGPDHPDTLSSVDNLEIFLKERGIE